MKKGKKLLLYGLAVLMAFQMPAISASAAQTGEIAQETVEAQTYEAVTATSGDFGVNNGLHWEYDTETKTVTVSGEDVPDVTTDCDEYWNLINKVFPSDTEKIRFENCQISSNMSYFFARLGKLKEVDFSGLTTSGLTDMESMFEDCSSLTSLDVSGFDTSNVTDMGHMFSGCSSLTNLDVSGFDTGNVTYMGGMFFDCSSLTSLDVSGFDTSNVIGMSFMFYNCSSLTSLDLSGFDTSSVISMTYMFSDCSSLISLDVSGFDTGSVTSMERMFDYCISLTTLVTPFKMGDITADLPYTFCTAEGINTSVLSKDFVGMTLHKYLITSGDFGVNNGLHWEYDTETKTVTVSGEDVSNITVGYDEYWNRINNEFPLDTEKIRFKNCQIKFNMEFFFAGLRKLNEIDFSGLTTSGLTNMGDMFSGCSSLTSLDVSGFETGKVTDMSWMFSGCSSLTSLDVSGFETGNVRDMAGMFSDCSSLTSLDVSGFETGNVRDMACMFRWCNSLTSLDVSGFETGRVTDMGMMFKHCSSLTNLDVSGFETGNVADMGMMFSDCSGLTSLDLSRFETGNVTDMSWMFSGCSSLTSLDLSGFKTGNVTDMSWMFSGCSSLTSLDLSGFDTVNVTNMDDMFNACIALTTLATPSKMGDVTADLPATFYTADGTATTVLSKDFAGTTLYKEGYLPETPATPLAITTQPVSAEAKDGSQATFTVSATGDGLTYQWQLCYAGDDTFRTCTFPGADTATLTVDATKARNGYSFRCVITDEHGSSVTSDVATLTVKTDVALGVALTASKTTADSGEIVTFTAVGNGGDGNYQYKFIINDTTNDKWYKLQDYSANNTIEWTATTAGTKRIMVDIKDGTGKSVGKNVSVVVNGTVAPAELKATLTASSYEVNPGEVVTLTAQGIGGSGKYNYKFIINDKTDDKWYRLQDYGTNSVIQWTATTPGTKRLMVDVMDSNGKKFGTNVTITVK